MQVVNLGCECSRVSRGSMVMLKIEGCLYSLHVAGHAKCFLQTYFCFNRSKPQLGMFSSGSYTNSVAHPQNAPLRPDAPNTDAKSSYAPITLLHDQRAGVCYPHLADQLSTPERPVKEAEMHSVASPRRPFSRKPRWPCILPYLS
jgi:hypothetical protein